VTADPPRPLSAGDHFDLGRAVLRRLEEKVPDIGDRLSLVLRFGFESAQGRSWLDDLLEGDEAKLIKLAEYLGVPVPGEAEDRPVDPSAADIDAYAELVSAETALREVIRLAVPKWIDDFTEEQVKKLEEKRTEEDKRRDGIAVSQDLLDYTEIYQLQGIVKKHWDPAVQAILDDKQRTDVYLGIIFDIRNTVGHSRPVFAAERLLLAGAAAQIRNQLARYRAKADGPQRHYPSLDSARDSMGTQAKSNRHLSHDAATRDAIWSGAGPTPRLEVGDIVTFELEATDPRGRELVWTAYSVPGDQTASMAAHGDYYRVIAEMTGERVSFTWTVGEDEVGEERQIAITVASTGKYHREQKWDDGCIFLYHINPPPDA
jgi:hypothetical protein